MAEEGRESTRKYLPTINTDNEPPKNTADQPSINTDNGPLNKIADQPPKPVAASWERAVISLANHHSGQQRWGDDLLWSSGGNQVGDFLSDVNVGNILVCLKGVSAKLVRPNSAGQLAGGDGGGGS